MSAETGRQAEQVAADYLEDNGFEILAKNWRNRWCEIDIVAKKDRSIHFVEVKFRRSSKYGSALDYVTKKKSKQMEFAALQWVGEHNWADDYQLDVVAVEGTVKPKITFIPNATGF